MPTPAEIISAVAALQNDTARTSYTNDACLPYLNLALDELQEIFEENNIPVTNEVSAELTVDPATDTVTNGQVIIAFVGTLPLLPSNLIEIQEVWESNDGGNTWIPMHKKDFIPHNLEELQLSSFGIWAWVDNEIHLPPATTPIILKLDYIKSIFATPITMPNIDTDLGVAFKNIKTYLSYKTAAICSMYIGENETRAQVLNMQADQALERALNIPIKGRQAIVTRRRPFRASYKSRGWY